MMGKKISGQTSMILIVLVIVIFIALSIFLLISSIKPTHDDYYNLYAHNLLLSVLRWDTGLGGDCDTISSTISCAYMTPYTRCGLSDCRTLAEEVVPQVVGSIVKTNFDYCIIVEPENKTSYEETMIYGPRCDVVQAKSTRWTANEKILQYEANIDIKMIIAEN